MYTKRRPTNFRPINVTADLLSALLIPSRGQSFSRENESEKRVEGDVISITGSLSSDVRIR